VEQELAAPAAALYLALVQLLVAELAYMVKEQMATLLTQQIVQLELLVIQVVVVLAVHTVAAAMAEQLALLALYDLFGAQDVVSQVHLLQISHLL
jgi:hypothetical protein